MIYIEDDPVYGDAPNEVFFSDWKDHNGVYLPETQITRLNGKKIREEHVRTVANNPPIENAAFLIPAEVKSQPENGQRIVSQWVLRRAVMGVGYQDFGREQKVELAEVARGVYHVRGGSHHSMVVEMKDHLVVVEAPLFDERSVAVIRALEERFPGKPVRYLVITHFHFDHLGGVRGYVAKGVTLLAHKSIVPFISEMNDRPHTLRPDSLAKISEKPAVSYSGIEGVTDVKALSDGERTIELRSVENDHASGMLIVYLPKEKVVFVSDLYSPPGPVPNPSVIFERVRATAFYDYLVKIKPQGEHDCWRTWGRGFLQRSEKGSLATGLKSRSACPCRRRIDLREQFPRLCGVHGLKLFANTLRIGLHAIADVTVSKVEKKLAALWIQANRFQMRRSGLGRLI